MTAPVTSSMVYRFTVPVQVSVSDKKNHEVISDRAVNQSVNIVDGPTHVITRNDSVPNMVIDNHVTVVKEGVIREEKVIGDQLQVKEVIERTVTGGTGGYSDSRSISEVKLDAPVIGEIVITFPDRYVSDGNHGDPKGDVIDSPMTNYNTSSYFSFEFNVQIGDIKVVIADQSSNVGDQNDDHVNPVMHV